MKLHTGRINFRQVSTGDINNIHELHSLLETDRFNTLGIPETIQVTESVINEWLVEQSTNPQRAYIFCLDLVATKQFIGLIALNIGKINYKTAEVWFKVHKDFWGKGYTTEALTKLLDFGFTDLALHRIEAGCAIENIASARVLEKAGMKREGLKRKKLPIRGEWKDSYFYAMLDEDFRGMQLRP